MTKSFSEAAERVEDWVDKVGDEREGREDGLSSFDDDGRTVRDRSQQSSV